jgi:hypothetical protein
MELDRLKFLARVNKTSGRKINDLSECWLWTGKPNTAGYGCWQTDYAKEKGLHFAHQAAYFHLKDDTYRPSREHPCSHRCEGGEVGSHRMCVNPDHLYIAGSIQENMADRQANHGNYQKKKTGGARNGTAAFTDEQKEEIRALRATGVFYKDIAEQYGVNRRTIEKLCLGKTYAD